MDNQHPKDKPLLESGKSNGLHVLSVKVNGKLDFKAIKAIRKILREHKINIIHSHDFKSNFYGLLASLNMGIKLVTTSHGSTRDSFLKKIYLFFDEKFVCRFFDAIIAVSTELSKQLKHTFRKPEKIVLIQNCIDPHFITNTAVQSNDTPIRVPDNHKVFGVIGRLYPDKGHRFFLEAFAQIHNTYSLTSTLIVGDGPARNHVAKEIQRLNLQESVILCGVRTDMKNVYDKIDCIVIPSLREGLPYVLLEALLCKIPVIASAVGDIPFIIEDHISGFLVQPGDIEGLERSMDYIIKYPDKAMGIAEKGYQLVKNKFSVETMIKNTENLYLSLST
jgi:glycosyltransferase involved in cell wall biosynthesis